MWVAEYGWTGNAANQAKPYLDSLVADSNGQFRTPDVEADDRFMQQLGAARQTQGEALTQLSKAGKALKFGSRVLGPAAALGDLASKLHEGQSPGEAITRTGTGVVVGSIAAIPGALCGPAAPACGAALGALGYAAGNVVGGVAYRQFERLFH